MLNMRKPLFAKLVALAAAWFLTGCRDPPTITDLFCDFSHTDDLQWADFDDTLLGTDAPAIEYLEVMFGPHEVLMFADDSDGTPAAAPAGAVPMAVEFIPVGEDAELDVFGPEGIYGSRCNYERLRVPVRAVVTAGSGGAPILDAGPIEIQVSPADLGEWSTQGSVAVSPEFFEAIGRPLTTDTYLMGFRTVWNSDAEGTLPAQGLRLNGFVFRDGDLAPFAEYLSE